MQDVDKNSLRYKVLQSAKNFKTSWIELGQALYTVWKDKLYKEWGYVSFDLYTAKEIGIKKQTAMKLLRSYFFLEKEEPDYLKDDYRIAAEAALVPSFEAIDVLRQVKSKKELDEHDYANFKKDIFDKGRDAREIKKDLLSLIRQRKELEPQEAREKKRVATVRRFLSTLKALEKEIESAKLLSGPLVKEINTVIKKLESEIHSL